MLQCCEVQVPVFRIRLTQLCFMTQSIKLTILVGKSIGIHTFHVINLIVYPLKLPSTALKQKDLPRG